MILAQASKIVPVLYTIIGFGLLILVHELGHFLFCKAFNIHTPTFSIGMGPTIFQKKIGQTNFKISALPIGGYVEIAGLQEVGQGDQEFAEAKDSTAFRSKPYWQKILVLGGGVTFNIIFAYIALILLSIIGFPKPIISIQSVEANSPAAIAGILPGDKILKIGESNIAKNPQLWETERNAILSNKYENLTIKISRDNIEKEIQVTFPKEISPTQKGKLGVLPESSFGEKEKLPFLSAIKRGITTTNEYIYQTLNALKQMFKHKTAKGVGGPVLIISQSIKFAQKGIFFLFIFLAMVSISLALMNLLPLPVLDGGQIIITTIESLIGREIPIIIKNYISLGSIFLIILLAIYITYNDILFLVKK